MTGTSFNVEVKNEHRHGKMMVSYTRSVDVDVYGYRIRLHQNRKVAIGRLVDIDGIMQMVRYN